MNKVTQKETKLQLLESRLLRTYSFSAEHFLSRENIE